MPAAIVTRTIKLLPGQAAIMTDFERDILAAIAGTGGGKTALGYWWLHSRMERWPGYTWGMAEPTFGMLSKIIMRSSDPDRPSLFDYFQQVGHHPDYRAVDRILQTDYGQIYLGSADNPDSMQGAAVKGYWLDEAGQMTLLAFETARQRCSMMRGQKLLTTTPYNIGWLKTEVWDRRAEPGYNVQTWQSIDRPGFPRESYEAERRRLPPWRFAMLYQGRFEKPAGLIYDSFDERVCLIPRFPIPPEWPHYSGHDFGGANPAAMFYAQNPATGDYYAVQEYLPGAGRSIHDHVKAFQEIAKGWTMLKRLGGSHQEEEIRQGYMAHGWPITEPTVREVEAGILKVIGVHRLNKLFVFNDLQHYLDEKRTYARELDDRGQATEKIAEKSRFHLCLIAGTSVKTQRGDIPVELVTIQDKVATRQGYRQVKACGLTDESADVVTGTFSNGVTLTGTPEHPIGVKGRGFVPLDGLRYCDIMEVWKEKQSSTEASSITGIPIPREGPTGFTSSRQRATSIVLCGVMHMGRYLKDFSSTILMVTHRIMSYLILSARPIAPTWQTTLSGMCMTLNTLQGLGPLLKPGTLHQKAVSGTVHIVGVPGPRRCRLPKSANNVAKNIELLSQVIVGSVPAIAKQLSGAEVGLITKPAFAPSAVKDTVSTDRQETAPVPDSVVRCLGVKPTGKAPVYNLTIDAVHEYYANGILVSNCDAERYFFSDSTPETVASYARRGEVYDARKLGR